MPAEARQIECPGTARALALLKSEPEEERNNETGDCENAPGTVEAPLHMQPVMTFLRQALIVLAVTVAAIEAAGLLIGNNGYFWFARQQYLSAGAPRAVGSEGLWTYAPNREVVSAATYRLSAIEGWVEYFCRFKTNHFGLIDTNYDKDRHGMVDYLVLGDSYLEGQGGCAWFTRASLPEQFPIVINSGIQGNGLLTMELFEKWLSPQVNIRNIALVLISNDFKRLLPTGIWTQGQECWVEARCRPRIDYVWGITPDVTRETLARLSHHFPDGRYESLWGQVVATLAYHSLTFNLIQRYAAILTSETKNPSEMENSVFERNFEALRRLRGKYPDLRIVLVPQRDEVGLLGVENGDTVRVRQFLAAEHIAYQFCTLGLDDFMLIDGHPNRAGYQKLRTCLERALH